jgi:outer membrane lipoprotein SlyB
MKLLALIMAALLATGCATTNRGSGANYNPIVDRANASYNQDLQECQAHATKVMSAGDGAMAGAIGGALIGALFSAAVGGGRYQNNYIATGALSGGLSAASSAEGGQRGIITRCLTGRGHNVLQ